MRSFAIDEPGSLVRALYATLLDTTNISEHLIILLNVSDRYRKLTTLKHFYTLYKLCCKGWCLHMRMCKGHSKRQSQRRKFLTPKISNNQGLHPSESVLIIFKRVLPLLLCPRTLWWPGMFPGRFKVKYFQWATLCVFQLRQKFELLSLTRIDNNKTNNKTRSNKTVPTHNLEVIFLSPDQFHLQECPRRRSRRRWGSWPRGTPWQHYIFGTVGQQAKKARIKKTF